MVKCLYYLKLSIFTVFMKNRNLISKIRISKVTDYAALIVCLVLVGIRYILNEILFKGSGFNCFSV